MIAHQFDSDVACEMTTSRGTAVMFAIGKIQETAESEPEVAFAVKIVDPDGDEIALFAMSKETYLTFMEVTKATFEEYDRKFEGKFDE